MRAERAEGGRVFITEARNNSEFGARSQRPCGNGLRRLRVAEGSCQVMHRIGSRAPYTVYKSSPATTRPSSYTGKCRLAQGRRAGGPGKPPSM